VRRRRPGHGDDRRAPLSEPVLLIPGLGQGAWVWREVAELLERERPVVLFEARGTGTVHAEPARETVAEMAEDAIGLLDSPAHVVGLSMGGYVALTLALAQPALVRSLVLVGTGGGGPGRVRRPFHVARAFDEAFGAEPEEFARRTMPFTFAPGWTEANPERFEELVALRVAQPTSYDTILAHAEACYAFYREGCEAERVTVPALVLHGDEDLIVPVENGRMLAARLPDVEYVELAGYGHNLPLEIPDALAGLLSRFLSRVEAGAAARPSTPSRP
jgi:pimeloyl-ACP methyl ester carboxylesterase